MNTIKVSHMGRWYTVYQQEWGMDCGPTCIAMAKLYLTGTGSDIDWLRRHTKAKLVSPGIEQKIQQLGMVSRDNGTYTVKLPELAKSIGLKAEYKYCTPPSLLDKLRTGSHNKTFIAHVAWNGGGGHFVVVPHVSANGQVVVLDPYFSLQTTNICPSYTGRGFNGRFTGNIVEISR